MLNASTEAALLRLLTGNPGDEPSTTPKLNRGTFENFLGFFDSFGVVFASEAPVPRILLTPDEIGAVFRHPRYLQRCPCPLQKVTFNSWTLVRSLFRSATQYPESCRYIGALDSAQRDRTERRLPIRKGPPEGAYLKFFALIRIENSGR